MSLPKLKCEKCITRKVWAICDSCGIRLCKRCATGHDCEGVVEA